MSKMSAQTPIDHVRKEVDRLVLALDRMDSGEWSRMANGIIDRLSPEDANALSRALIKKLYGDMVWQAVEFGANANEFMDSAARRNSAAMNATGGGRLCAADALQVTRQWVTRGWEVAKGALVGNQSGGKGDVGRVAQRGPSADDKSEDDDSAKRESLARKKDEYSSLDSTFCFPAQVRVSPDDGVLVEVHAGHGRRREGSS